MRRYLWICLLIAASMGACDAFAHGSLPSVHSSRLRLSKLSAARKTRYSDPEVQERQRCEALQQTLSKQYEEIKANLEKEGTKVATYVADSALELWRLHAKPANKKLKAENYKLLVQCPPDAFLDLITRLQKHPDFRQLQFAGFRPGIFPRIFNREVYSVAMPLMFHFALETACERSQITCVDVTTGEPKTPTVDYITSLQHDFDMEHLYTNFGANITLYGSFVFPAIRGFEKPEPREPLVPPELIPPRNEVDRRPKRVKRKEERERLQSL